MSSQEQADEATEPLAARVVLSFPADIGEHGRGRIRSDYYRKYLTKVHDSAAEGDEWDEFTDVGCCGSQMDVPLVVERVVTESTTPTSQSKAGRGSPSTPRSSTPNARPAGSTRAGPSSTTNPRRWTKGSGGGSSGPPWYPAESSQTRCRCDVTPL